MSSTRLPCGHEFHARCVAELRRFGASEVCPLCRAPLPPGAESLCREATELMLRKRSPEAEALLWAALRDEPKHAQSLNNLGSLLLKKHDLKKARLISERLVDDLDRKEGQKEKSAIFFFFRK